MSHTTPRPFSGIFISYRRDDSAGHAGRLFDRLSAHFGQDQVFMDIDHIEPGEDFAQVIEDAVSSCEILIAIIGRHWLSSAGEVSRRLDNPNDFVRLEITAALNRNIRVIPLLVQRATMPGPQDLPDNLAKLSRRHALELSDLRWNRDVDQLIGAIEKILAERREPRHRAVQEDEERQRRETETQRRQEPVPRPAPSKRALLLLVSAFLVVTVLAAALFGGKLGWTTKQHDAENTNTSAGNTNTASATNGSQTEKQKNSPMTPAGMVYVPGAEFMMGRDDGDDVSERPAHHVPSLRPFFIDAHEVACDEYAKFIQVTGHRQPPGWVDDKFPVGAEHRPVTGVTWEDARDYCERNDKRLPTETEWEFAARGTDGRLYPWGNKWQPGMANAGGAATRLADVETYKGASPFGALDMVGNAWEWTASDMRAYPGGRLPPDLSVGELKVIRGGSYESTKNTATTTYRTGWPARNALTYDQTGFRCVRDVVR